VLVFGLYPAGHCCNPKQALPEIEMKTLILLIIVGAGGYEIGYLRGQDEERALAAQQLATVQAAAAASPPPGSWMWNPTKTQLNSTPLPGRHR